MPYAAPTHRPGGVAPKGRREARTKSSSARGYDWTWREKFRTWFLGFVKDGEVVNLKCGLCGGIPPKPHLDHVEGFEGIGDADRLDPAKIVTLCPECHSKKTRECDTERGCTAEGARILAKLKIVAAERAKKMEGAY